VIVDCQERGGAIPAAVNYKKEQAMSLDGQAATKEVVNFEGVRITYRNQAETLWDSPGSFLSSQKDHGR
jgi:hypothetical protein